MENKWIYLLILIGYTMIFGLNLVAFIGWIVLSAVGVYYGVYYGSRFIVKFIVDLIKFGQKYKEN